MEELLDDETKAEISNKFSDMEHDVLLICVDGGKEMGALLEGLAALSPKLSIERREIGDGESERLGISQGPMVLLRGEGVKGDLRFYGLPEGYEFPAFIEAVLLASRGSLKGPAAEFAKSLGDGLKVEVFVAPGCPYCPTSALVAAKLAIAGPNVKGYVYNAQEFPELSAKYNVSGVPKTVINEGAGEYVGGLPEDSAVMAIRKAIS